MNMANSRLKDPTDLPPSYSPVPLRNTATGIPESTADDPYAFLSNFDTVILVDDSGSMGGRSWRDTLLALKTITPICTAHDLDGIDIHFLNHPDRKEFSNVKSAGHVEEIFGTVKPRGTTPTGMRLKSLLEPYLERLEGKGTGAVKNLLSFGKSKKVALQKRFETIKPLNIIVITDGVPNDDVESVVINAAKRLDKMDAPAWQVGIQFFQVGNERGAAEALKELDDGIAELGSGCRDIVDTVPWRGNTGEGLNGDGILKVVLGAVNRRLDRKKNSGEWRRDATAGSST
jgi:hypothetical protein